MKYRLEALALAYFYAVAGGIKAARIIFREIGGGDR